MNNLDREVKSLTYRQLYVELLHAQAVLQRITQMTDAAQMQKAAQAVLDDAK